MRGTLKECFEHYARSVLLPNFDLRQLATEFFGTEQHSVLRWSKSRKLPCGVNRIRMQYLLEFAGYEIHELKKLSTSVRDAGRLFSFRALDADDIISACQFGRNQFLRILTGRGKTVTAREEALIALVKEREGKLPELQKPFAPLRALPAKAGLAEAVHVIPVEERSSDALDKKACAGAVILLARAMKPLVEILNSDIFSPADRREVHERAGNETLFSLSTALNCLCSEKSRKTRRKS